MSILGYVGEHPYMSGGAVLVAGVLIVLVLRKPAAAAPVATSTPGYDPGYNAAVVNANAGLMQAQLTANAHAADTQASLSAHLGDNDAAITIAQIAATTNVNAANIAGSLGSQSIAAGITGQQLTNDHDIAIAGMSRDVALGAQQIADNANARGAATQDAADQLNYYLGSQSISAKQAVDLGTLANANAADSRHVALADTVSARAHIEAQTGFATQQYALNIQQAMNTDNNTRMLAARTIQVGSDNTIAASNDSAAASIAQIQGQTAVSVSSNQASALETQSAWSGVASILGSVGKVASTAIAA